MAQHVIPALLGALFSVTESSVRNKYKDWSDGCNKAERLQWKILKIQSAIDESEKYDIQNDKLLEMQQKLIDAALEGEELLLELGYFNSPSSTRPDPPVLAPQSSAHGVSVIPPNSTDPPVLHPQSSPESVTVTTLDQSTPPPPPPPDPLSFPPPDPLSKWVAFTRLESFFSNLPRKLSESTVHNECRFLKRLFLNFFLGLETTKGHFANFDLLEVIRKIENSTSMMAKVRCLQSLAETSLKYLGSVLMPGYAFMAFVEKETEEILRNFFHENNFLEVIRKIEKLNRVLEKLQEMSNDVGDFLEMVRQQKRKRDRRRRYRPYKHFFKLVYLDLVQDAVGYCRAQVLWMQFLRPEMATFAYTNRKSGVKGSGASISAVPEAGLDAVNFSLKSLLLV